MRKRKLTMRTGALCTLCACVLSAALLAPACTENLGLSPAGSGRDLVLGLKMEPATKVAVDDVSGGLAWTAGDEVAVRIFGYTPAEDTYKTAAVDVSSSTVNVELEGDQDIVHYSVYPASARDDNNFGRNNGTDLQVKYAASYAVPSGLSGEALNKWSPVPMVAANTDGGTPPTPKTTLQFYHVGGVLRIKLSNVPPGTTSCTVTLEGMTDITGTFKVEYPGTATANTDVMVTGTGNTVEFTNIPAIPTGEQLWLNVPLPTGDYAALTRVKVTAVAPNPADNKTVAKAVKWNGGMVHAQGRRLSFNFNAQAGELDNVSLSPAGDATLWKDQPYQCVAMACDVNGLFVSGATISWSSSDESVAEVDNAGNVTAKAAGSAVLTATATVGTSTATADYTVYVNEITGLTLSCGATTTLIIGKDKPVTATATYTMNGDPEPPLVDWSVTGPATPAKTVTASGAANTLTVAATATVGSSGTITVSANRYGTGATATCSYKILSSNYLPGAFSISPTEQVYFSRGNLQVNYTNNGGTITREWLFSENQWDIFCPTADELYSLPTPAEGTTVKLSHFGWATAGHENPSSPGGNNAYAYITVQKFFEPYEARPYPISGNSRYGVDLTTWRNILGTGSNLPYRDNNDWNAEIVGGVSPANELRSYCDWGVHFDDNGVGHPDKYDGEWFTMSLAQWKYLFFDRPGARQKASSGRSVFDAQNLGSDWSNNGNGVNGYIILPDDWQQCPAGCTFVTPVPNNGDYQMTTSQGFPANTYDVVAWSMMEAAGAVFLPAAGSRRNRREGGGFENNIPYSQNIVTTQEHPSAAEGSYWTSSIHNASGNSASTIDIYHGRITVGSLTTAGVDSFTGCATGLSVRLVHKVTTP